MDSKLETFVRRTHAVRHIYNRYRIHMRYLAAPIFMSFGIVDYLYRSDLFLKWFAYRLTFVAFIWVAFNLMSRFSSIRRRSVGIAITSIIFACAIINVMIYQTGGFKSLYMSGLILCAVTGTQIFRLRREAALMANTGAYLPAVVIFLSSANSEQMTLAIIQSSFLIGMTLLAYVYGWSEDSAEEEFERARRKITAQLERSQRSDFLKRHFPIGLREDIENGTFKVEKRTLFESAVVGFADIVSSTAMSNAMNLNQDWEIKERFLEAATRRATDHELIVLTHLGDGFLFLANYRRNTGWSQNLISFFENLSADFEKIVNNTSFTTVKIDTGVKFGVSCGPVLVGMLGRGQAYFTAIGPDVNLAARLCSVAKANEIVVSNRVWHSVEPVIQGWNFSRKSYDALKGFEQSISAVHITTRTAGRNATACPHCGYELSLVQTKEGFLDLRCPNEEAHTFENAA